MGGMNGFRMGMAALVVSAAAAATSLSGCALTQGSIEAAELEAGIEKMSADRIRETHLGNSAEGLTANGQTFQVYFAPDGAVRAKLDGETDSLEYTITDENRICGAWTRWLSAEETCYTLYKEEEGIRFYDGSGGFRGQYVIKQGNAFGL